MRLACIVEGHGEVEALPILLRRIATRIAVRVELQIGRPVRIQRSRLLKPGELEKAVHLAAAKVGAGGAILIVLDSDDDCPATLAPDLLRRAQAARSDMSIAVVLAHREFESWFLAASESLRSRFRPADDAKTPADVEGIRGAKEVLKRKLASGRYSPTVDQPALAAVFDLEQARTAPSFDKLWREMERLLRTA